jgi:hypothetical protein
VMQNHGCILAFVSLRRRRTVVVLPSESACAS